MLKTTILSLLLLVSVLTVKAQTTDTSAVYNNYLDLNLAVLEVNLDEAISLSNKIMPDSAALPVKTRVSYYNILGRLYENDQPAEAIKYYSRVAAAEPDYYVVHRALGYLYLKEVNKATGDDFKHKAKTALFHLEKAQACDPSPETLETIQLLYKNMGDTAGLKTLDTRLKQRAKHCIDILETQ